MTIEWVAPGEVDGAPYDAVVPAMPDPQARQLLEEAPPLRGGLDDGAGSAPSITIALDGASHGWPRFHAAFVSNVCELTFCCYRRRCVRV